MCNLKGKIANRRWLYYIQNGSIEIFSDVFFNIVGSNGDLTVHANLVK